MSRLECGGGKSLSSRIVPPLMEASNVLSLPVSGTNSSPPSNKVHTTLHLGSTSLCMSSSSVTCSPSADRIIQVAENLSFANKSNINNLDDILSSSSSSDLVMACDIITDNAEGPSSPTPRVDDREKATQDESELGSGSRPATAASPVAAVVEAEEAATTLAVKVKETEARSTDKVITNMEVEDAPIVVDEIAATPTSEVDEAMTTLTSVVAEDMDMAASVATPISAVEEAMDMVEELVAQKTNEDVMEPTTPADEVGSQLTAAASDFQAPADEPNTASEIGADEATSLPTMQIDETTTVPTTKSDTVKTTTTAQADEVVASEAAGIVTSSTTTLEIDGVSAAAFDEDTTTVPAPVDDGMTNARTDLFTTEANEVTNASTTETAETNSRPTRESDEIMASPTTAADEVVTAGTASAKDTDVPVAAAKDTDKPVAASNEVEPEVLIEMESTLTPDDTISAKAKLELSPAPDDGTTNLVDKADVSDLERSTEIIDLKSSTSQSSEVIATRSVKAIEVVNATYHKKEGTVTIPELGDTSAAKVSTSCRYLKAEVSSSNDEVLPMEICQESTTDVSRTKSQLEDLSSNPGIGLELPVDVGSLKALCSKVLNLPTSSLNLQPSSSNFVLQTRPMSSASDTITVFSTPTITSSVVLISTLSKEMKVSQNDQMLTQSSAIHFVPRLSELASSSLSSLPKLTPSPHLTESESIALNSSESLPSEMTSSVLEEERANPDLPLPVVATSTSRSMPATSVSVLPAAVGTGGRPTAPNLFSLTEHLAREVDRDNVFLCRHIYDIKLRRISKNPNMALHSVHMSSHNGIPFGGSNSGSR